MKGNFNTIIDSDIPVLVDFWAEWCQPCRVQSPIVEQVAGELGDKVKVIKIDVDKNPGISGRYQIRSIPTLILFKNGGISWRKSGLTSREELVSILSSYSPR